MEVLQVFPDYKLAEVWSSNTHMSPSDLYNSAFILSDFQEHLNLN